MIHVALLRGINVGGKNKISMASLKETFQRLGLTNVTTYINSGNVIFSDVQGDESGIAGEIEPAIRDDFDLEIPVVLRNLSQMQALLDALPAPWVNDKITTANAMFLWHEIDNPEILDRLEVKPEYDEVSYVPGALLWRVSKEVLASSGMMRLAGSPLYRKMTVRNVNTVRRVAAIMQQLAGDA